MTQKVITIGATGGLVEADNAAQTAGYQPQPPATITKEYTGFDDPTAITVSYNSTTRKITLTGTFSAYWQGVLIAELTDGWVSAAHTATNTSWYLYYNGTSFVWSTSPWTFDMLMIAYVYYGTSDKFGIRECHGMMDHHAHEEFHRTIGTYRESGGDLGGYTLNTTTIAERRPSVGLCYVHDEDIRSAISALEDGGPYTQLALASTGTSTFTTGAADIVPLSGNQPYYNSYSAPNWGQTLMSNNTYMTVWLVAAPTTADTASLAYRYLWVQGQSNGSLVSQQSYQFGSMNLGQLATLYTEFVAIMKIIIKYSASNWTIYSVETLPGTRLNNTTAPAGSYLSSVTATSPLSGSGTVADPLVVAAFAGSTSGVVPTSVGGTANYLRADGSWATPPGAAAPTPSTVSGSTSSLAAGASGNFDIVMPVAATIISVTTDYPAWVRLYTLSSWRTSDSARTQSTDPTAGTGVTFDVATISGTLGISLQPAAIFINTDTVDPNKGFIRVTNNDSTTRTITVTIKYITMSA